MLINKTWPAATTISAYLIRSNGLDQIESSAFLLYMQHEEYQMSAGQ